MFTPEDDATIAGTTRTLQVLTAALTLGPLILAGVALVVNRGPRPGTPALTYVGFAFALSVVAARLVVPRAILARARAEIARGTWKPPASRQALDHRASPQSIGEVGALCAVLQTTRIVSLALVEAIAFFAGVAYLVEGRPEVFALLLFLALEVTTNFPTRQGVEDWVQGQLALIEELRQLPG